MKLECLKEKLHIAVSRAEKIAGKNAAIPVLSCLLLETKGNSLVVKATNLDLGIEITVPVKVSEQGSVAVPAAVLAGFLNNIGDDRNVRIEVVDTTVRISTENSSASIKTMPKDDFPTIPTVENGKVFKIHSRDFAQGVKSVMYSASTSSIKPELSSVYMYGHENTVVFVATDSFRLAEKTILVKKQIDTPGILIPLKNAVDMMKIIEATDEELEITATKNQLSLVFGGIYVVSRVIDGVFPDYKQIIPKEEKTRVVVLKQDLLSVMKISNVFSDTFNQMHIAVSAGAKQIEVRTKNAAVGENENRIDATTSGEDVSVNFNYRYIADCLPSITADSIALAFNGANRALVIRGVSDKTFLYLVMPMNR